MGDAIVLMPAQFTVKVGPSLQCECQVSEATVSFNVSSATIKTLCQEADLATVEKGKLTLAGYQDWTDPAGLCNFLWTNALATAEFEIVGTGADTAVCTLTGNMQCRRPSFGPTADNAAKFSLDIPCIGIPTLVVTPAP